MINIFKAFILAQSEFKGVKKGEVNPFHKSKYASITDIIEGTFDVLHRHGLAVTQKTSIVDSGVCVESILIHESGDMISGGELFVPAKKTIKENRDGTSYIVEPGAQEFGSALTYARRYSLLSLLCLSVVDDDGNQASGIKEDKKEDLKYNSNTLVNTDKLNQLSTDLVEDEIAIQGSQRPASDKQIQFVRSLIRSHNVAEGDFEFKENIKINEMTSSQASFYIKKLQNGVKK